MTPEGGGRSEKCLEFARRARDPRHFSGLGGGPDGDGVKGGRIGEGFPARHRRRISPGEEAFDRHFDALAGEGARDRRELLDHVGHVARRQLFTQQASQVGERIVVERFPAPGRDQHDQHARSAGGVLHVDDDAVGERGWLSVTE